MGLSALSLMLFIFLVISLMIISYIDYKYMRLADYYLVLVFICATLFLISMNPTSQFYIYLFMTLLAIITIGSVIFKEGNYGGADIKLMVALSPLIVFMQLTGVLFMLWFFLNPYLSKLISSKSKSKFASSIKMPFIPVISAVFIFLLSLILFM
jgi:Flp pilus assembly protein protease CpaA